MCGHASAHSHACTHCSTLHVGLLGYERAVNSIIGMLLCIKYFKYLRHFAKLSFLNNTVGILVMTAQFIISYDMVQKKQFGVRPDNIQPTFRQFII